MLSEHLVWELSNFEEAFVKEAIHNQKGNLAPSLLSLTNKHHFSHLEPPQPRKAIMNNFPLGAGCQLKQHEQPAAVDPLGALASGQQNISFGRDDGHPETCFCSVCCPLHWSQWTNDPTRQLSIDQEGCRGFWCEEKDHEKRSIMVKFT